METYTLPSEVHISPETGYAATDFFATNATGTLRDSIIYINEKMAILLAERSRLTNISKYDTWLETIVGTSVAGSLVPCSRTVIPVELRLDGFRMRTDLLS